MVNSSNKKYKNKYKNAKNEIENLKSQVSFLQKKVDFKVSSTTRRNKYKELQKVLQKFEPTETDFINCDLLFSKALQCPELMAKKTSSISAAVIYIGIPNLTKDVICEKCSVSLPTLNKISTILKNND